VLNERFGTNFTATDELFWEQVRDDAIASSKRERPTRATILPMRCSSIWKSWW
jgi:hypothetical protein